MGSRKHRADGPVLHVCTGSDALQHIAPTVIALSQAGYRLHVTSASGPELTALGRAASGVRIHPLRIQRAISLREDSRALAQLYRLIRELRPQIVHAHTPKAGLLGMLAAKLNGVPCRIYQVHGLRYETSTLRLRKLLRATEKLACRSAHRILCVSPSVRTRLIADDIVPAAKTVVLGFGSACGVELDSYSFEEQLEAGRALRGKLGLSNEGVCVGYAGRLSADKGLSELQSAWPHIARSVPGAHLLIAGEDDPTDPVDLSSLRRRNDVYWLGNVAEMMPFYAALDLLVLPSHREGLGQVVLEAAALEVPTVGTRVTGLVDSIVDGETGALIPARDPRALEKHVVSLLCDLSLRRSLGAAGRAFVTRRYSQSAVLHSVVDWYDSLF